MNLFEITQKQGGTFAKLGDKRIFVKTDPQEFCFSGTVIRVIEGYRLSRD